MVVFGFSFICCCFSFLIVFIMFYSFLFFGNTYSFWIAKNRMKILFCSLYSCFCFFDKVLQQFYVRRDREREECVSEWVLCGVSWERVVGVFFNFFAFFVVVVQCNQSLISTVAVLVVVLDLVVWFVYKKKNKVEFCY